MKVFCALLLTSLLSVCDLVPQNRRQDNGNYDFSFHAGSHYRRENKAEDGVISGEYGFRSPDGCMHVVHYRANAGGGGYRVLRNEKKDCVRRPRRPIFRRPTTTSTTTTTTTTTTTPPPTTTTTTTPRPTTTTTKPPLPKPLKPVENTIDDRKGKSLNRPPRPAILSPDDPEPDYSFGFSAPGHGHSQAGLPDGTKKGEYYFDSPDGWRRIVSYVATKKGFFPKMRRVRIPTTTTANPLRQGKQLVEPEQAIEEEAPPSPPPNGCPYFFYYNTQMNYQWERCHEDGNKTGEYGRLAEDGFAHKVAYYADATGYHPKVQKIPLTTRQLEIVAEYTERTFIIRELEEERRSTEERIKAWIRDNRNELENPLQL